MASEGVNSSGEPVRFGEAMEILGDRLLAAIDDGMFDPAPIALLQPQALVCIDCINGQHEVSGHPDCTCVCHGNHPKESRSAG